MRPGFGVRGSRDPVIDSPQLDRSTWVARPTPQLVDPVDKPEQRSCCVSGLCVGERGACDEERGLPTKGWLCRALDCARAVVRQRTDVEEFWRPQSIRDHHLA